MSIVKLYTRAECHLCHDALATIEDVRSEIPFDLVEIDIDLDEQTHAAYFERIPVVEVDGDELCEYFVDADELKQALCPGRRADSCL